MAPANEPRYVAPTPRDRPAARVAGVPTETPFRYRRDVTPSHVATRCVQAFSGTLVPLLTYWGPPPSTRNRYPNAVSIINIGPVLVAPVFVLSISPKFPSAVI